MSDGARVLKLVSFIQGQRYPGCAQHGILENIGVMRKRLCILSNKVVLAQVRVLLFSRIERTGHRS